MELFKNLFKPKKKVFDLKITGVKRDQKRTYDDSATLNDWERSYIRSNKCPDCPEHAYLCEGPSGGMSTNMLCPNCGSKFNVTEPMTSARISNSSLHPNNPAIPDPEIKKEYLFEKEKLSKAIH